MQALLETKAMMDGGEDDGISGMRQLAQAKHNPRARALLLSLGLPPDKFQFPPILGR